MALTPQGVIGNTANQPWFLPWQKLEGDLPRFKKLTAGHVVIMGRGTCEIFKKPLPDRINLVVSRNPKWEAPEGFRKFSTLSAAIQSYENQTEKIFLIGGSGIIEEGFKTKVIDEMILTETHDDFLGDVYFPKFDKSEWKIINRESFPDFGYDVVHYELKS